MWAKLAEWKLANPEGTLKECKRDLRGHLTEDDIKELIAWHLLWELAHDCSISWS